MKIDISATPFSRFGSYLSFSILDEKRLANTGLRSGLWLRCVHGDAGREVFLVEVTSKGKSVPFETSATPGELTLITADGRVRICIVDEDQIRVRGEGVGLRLTARNGSYNCAMPQNDGNWLLNIATAFRNYMLVPLNGEVKVDAPWGIAKCEHVIVDLTPDQSGTFEAAIDQFVAAWLPKNYSASFDAVAAATESEFYEFLSAYGPAPAGLEETVEAAAYLNWSTVVNPCGFYRRPSMLMSKNWMCNVWSWDHAFNALGLAYAHPGLAWDQLMAMFDHQHPEGQLPDFINDVVRLYNFVKPPIHGWILSKMMEIDPWFSDSTRVGEIYGPLCLWTEFWFNHRNPDCDGLPQYHHGNDSGWDNGTVFDVGLPVKGADLAAFLVVQMSTLSKLAEMLGRDSDAARWKARSEETLGILLSKLWRGDRFVCPSALDGSITEQSDSIFGCLPIILGDLLPAEMRAKLAASIERHLTEWGPATENVESPLYDPDGYWRGPIWAPPTMIIADGLRRAGETELAKEIARRFCNLCKKSGFAENYDAKTGEPLRDKAYTWTSSVFLSLAYELLTQ